MLYCIAPCSAHSLTNPTTHSEALTGTIHQASGPVSGAHKCAGTRSTRAEILLPTSLARAREASLDNSGSSVLLRRGGSAPVSHQNPRPRPPPPRACNRWGASPGSSVAPYRGDRSRMSAQFPTVFVFSPTGRPLGAKESRLSLCALGRGALFCRPAPPRVYAPKATFPMFPPWALWVPVKSADFSCQLTWLGLILRGQRDTGTQETQSESGGRPVSPHVSR